MKALELFFGPMVDCSRSSTTYMHHAHHAVHAKLGSNSNFTGDFILKATQLH